MKHDISKYIISSLLLVFGLVALFSYISGLMGDGLESQPHTMLLAALSLIGVGVIALPEVLDKLDAKKYKSIMMAGVELKGEDIAKGMQPPKSREEHRARIEKQMVQ